MPAIFAFFSTKPEEGIEEPIGAKATLMPALAFGAPQTIDKGSFCREVCTKQTCNFCEFGCGETEIISATVKLAKDAE